MEHARILVVDPDVPLRLRYRSALEAAGHTVVEAADGRDALVEALVRPPRLLITETRLPAMDGYALCEILRRDRVTCTLPILVVTADGAREQLERAREAGADAVLVKPAAPDLLLGETQRLLDQGSMAGRRPAAPDGAARQPAQGDGHDGRPQGAGAVRSRVHARFDTTEPPALPPSLHCPVCDCALVYRRSYVGGVSSRHPEQWDYYTCPRACGAFEYRQRTRKLRRVERAVVPAR